MSTQQGDVLLFQTADDGEILVVEGVTTMVGGFETMVYLCLFGGNEDDDGSADSPENWWGNRWETDADYQYRSLTQHLLRSIPATTGNLQRIADAVHQDLAVFKNKSIASSVVVSVSIPAINTVSITVTIIADGVQSQFNYTENWSAAA